MISLRQCVRYEIDDECRDALRAEVLRRLAGCRLEPDLNDTILGAIGSHALANVLPGDALLYLKEFGASGCHALVIGNLPVEPSPPTPVTGFTDELAMTFENALHLGLIRTLGLIPFAVDYENNGRLIRNVVPNPAAAGQASSWGSDFEFFWHSDNPQLPFGIVGMDPRLFAPPFLTFLTLRNREAVPTELAALEDVVVRLDDDTLDQLQRPDFDISPPDSNDRTAVSGLERVPVIDWDQMSRFRVRFDRGTTIGRSAAARAALAKWCETLGDCPAEQLVLRRGDFLVFDNYRALHRRKSFKPDPPDSARWLRRCYAA